MFRSNYQRVFVLAAAALAGVATLSAATTVTYTASGTFGTTVLAGEDMLKLAGEPFTLTISASESLPPTDHGHTWAEYTNLTLNGTVYSNLLPGVPITIMSATATMVQVEGRNQSNQLLALQFPIEVLAYNLTVTAKIALPLGTIPNALINPFSAPVTMAPPDFLTYADTDASTTLSLASGTVSTTTSAARPPHSAATVNAPQFYSADLLSGNSARNAII